MIKTGVVLLALSGAFHCVGMCSPLIAALHAGRPLTWQVQYHAGRIFSYLLLGSFAGMLSAGMAFFLTQQQLSVLSGLLLLFYVLMEWLGKNKAAYRLSNRLRELAQHYGKQGGGFFLGMANGLLPCGLVYGAAFLSAAEGNMLRVWSNMLLFGIITTVLLVGVRWMWRRLLSYLKPIFSGVALQRLVMVLLAAFLIIRGLGQGAWWSPAVKMTAGERPVVECR
ncbi:sulfite exporter TauE/SafE family protein [Thermonema rossianum]|uniref:sulfite exporter TauE/SafE family protein n=1 Tax=Thermonema rossianum TaxID=55505 RepID=UPI00057111F8|nr:sulfite exporter TauE/SafE family protein [Thermonema rossianum]